MKSSISLPLLGLAAILCAHAEGATVVSNSTGLPTSSIIFLDYESQAGTTNVVGIGSMVSTRGGTAGNDGDAVAFGALAGYASTGAVTYSYTELVAGQTYNIYANWYGNGADNSAITVTANSISLGTFSQIAASTAGSNGFTAYQDTAGSDPSSEVFGFRLLGTAVADANGDIVIVSGLGNRTFFRNDAFAVAAVPEPSSCALAGIGALLLLRRRK